MSDCNRKPGTSPDSDARPTVLITGCSSGVGYHVAHALHKQGWRVFATARSPHDCWRLQREGLESYPLDLASDVSVQACVAHLKRRTEVLDAVYHNGGLAQAGAIEDISRDAWVHQFQVNTFGPMRLTGAVLPWMREQGHGRLIFMSSMLAYTPMKFRGAYNASKAALDAVCEALRLEVASSPLHVSLIHAGPLRSAFRDNAQRLFEQTRKAQSSHHEPLYQEYQKATQNSRQPFMQGPEAVMPLLHHALTSKRPRLRYRVTWPAHLFWHLKQTFPAPVFDAIMGWVGRTHQ